MSDITAKDLIAMFVGIAAAIEAEKGRLSELDGVIGDADHGVTMSIGFRRSTRRSRDLIKAVPTRPPC